jgi:hypothetical protein
MKAKLRQAEKQALNSSLTLGAIITDCHIGCTTVQYTKASREAAIKFFIDS